MNAGSVGMVGLMAANPSLPSEDGGSKKIRKPYTITKSRESWTEQEHDKFLEALQLFDRDWKKIEAFVGSKTVIQIRSHAQKYFLKVQKNGTGEHVPPPRPKRKSAQPYPQKAAKAAPPAQTNARVLPVPHTAAEYGYVIAPQQCNVYVPAVSATVSPWVHHAVPPGTIPYSFKDANQPELATPASGMKNQSHSSSTDSTWSQNVPAQPNTERVHPAFPEVYQFIGSVFDPEVTGHLKKLREMAPIDKETVLLLMRNLAINLASPDFDERKLFANSTDDKSNTKTDCSDVQVPFRSNETVTETSPGGPANTTKGNTNNTRFCDRPREVIRMPADVSKHQRHPYDGGGLGVQAEQIKDELDYISEVLEGTSDIELAYDSQPQQLGVPSSGTTEEDSYELGLEGHTPHQRQLSAPVNNKAGEEEESVDRWWRP